MTSSQSLNTINLLKGWPNPSLLPIKAITNASSIALSDPSIYTPGLLYAPDPGYQPLRQEVAKWLEGFYGSYGGGEAGRADAERICISGGASQNLACVLQVFSDPIMTRVWMVAPCYYLACRIFEDSGLRLRGVPEGEDGIDLELLEKGILEAEAEDSGNKALKSPKPWAKFYKHIIYLVPTFSNPSGKTMPLLQRQKLVQLARKYDALIITDDVYDFLQWPTDLNTNSSPITHAPVPRLVDVDRTLSPVPSPESFGNTISNGSFSKIVGPGVRTGWAEATPKFIYGLSQCGSSRSGGAASQFTATFITEMLKNNSLQQHIQSTLCPAYQKRYSVILSAIQKYLLPLGVKLGETSFGEKKLFGGYFMWLELPRGVSGDKVVQRAKEEWNLIVSPGKVFEVNGDARYGFEGVVRLCFAWEEESALEEGVRRLSKVVESELEHRK